MIFLMLDNSKSVYDAPGDGCGGGGGGGIDGAAAVTGGATAVGVNASTSSTVILPLGPVPATFYNTEKYKSIEIEIIKMINDI